MAQRTAEPNRHEAHGEIGRCRTRACGARLSWRFSRPSGHRRRCAESGWGRSGDATRRSSVSDPGSQRLGQAAATASLQLSCGVMGDLDGASGGQSRANEPFSTRPARSGAGRRGSGGNQHPPALRRARPRIRHRGPACDVALRSDACRVASVDRLRCHISSDSTLAQGAAHSSDLDFTRGETPKLLEMARSPASALPARPSVLHRCTSGRRCRNCGRTGSRRP
jgi:hypothetical protein